MDFNAFFNLLRKNLGPSKPAHFVVIYIYMYCISDSDTFIWILQEKPNKKVKVNVKVKKKLRVQKHRILIQKLLVKKNVPDHRQ